ncbi:hypothetical protein ACWGS9_14215 [Bradyrhizobium sp. Arg314]
MKLTDPPAATVSIKRSASIAVVATSPVNARISREFMLVLSR